MRICKKIFSLFLVAIFMITNVFVYPIEINAANVVNEMIQQENLIERFSKTWETSENLTSFKLPITPNNMVIEFNAQINEFSGSEPLGVKLVFKGQRLMFKVSNDHTVSYCDENSTWAITKNVQINSGVNKYRIECDGEAGTANLFINGTKINDRVIKLHKRDTSTEYSQIWSGNSKVNLNSIQIYEVGKVIINEQYEEATPQKISSNVYEAPSGNSIVEFRAKVNQFANGEVLGAKVVIGNQRLMLKMLSDKLQYCNATSTWGPSVNYPVGDKWHVYRLENDFDQKTSNLYVDGNLVAKIDLQQNRSETNVFQIWSSAGEAVLDYVLVYEKMETAKIPMWQAEDKLQVTSSNQSTSSQLTISWPAATHANRYLVRVKDTLNEHSVYEKETTATELTVQNLQKGIGYHVEVQAINDVGVSDEKLQAYQDTHYDFSNESQLSIKNLMVAGKGYESYRIPSLVATSKGTLLAMAEARSSSSDWAPMDAVLMRSEDGGETWSQRTIMAAGKDEGYACNNPILIPAVDDQGRSVVLLVYCKDYGIDIHGQGGVFVRKSVDDGNTWSAPYEITENCLPDYRNVIATGPGHGIQLKYNQEHKGRLVVSVWMTPKKYGKPVNSHGPAEVATLYSDDMGTTWKMGELVPLGDVVNPNESTVVELNDGRVMINMRNTTGKQQRAVSISPDGISNWSEPYFDDELNCPVCFGSLVRYDDNTILFVNPDTKSGRTKGTVKVSYDNGKTWPVKRMLNLGSSGYADIAVSEVNGEKQISVLLETVVSETNGNNSLTLYRFPLSWITEGMNEKLVDLTVNREKIDLQKDVFNYKVKVGLGQKDVVLSATAFDKELPITINGEALTGDTMTVQLNSIHTVIKIKVGNTEYTLQVEKEIPASSDDCVLHYTMDNMQDGIIKDNTEYSNDGTARNGVTVSTDAKFGQSVTIKNGEVISTNSKGLAFGTGNFTVNAWIKPHNVGNEQLIFWYGSLGTGAKAWWLRYNKNGSLQLLLGDGKGHEETITTSANIIPVNQWSNITVLRDEKVIKILVDGVEKASKVMNADCDVNGENVFTIAYDKAGRNRKFEGQMDEVRAYNYTLTLDQIKGLMENNEPVSKAKDILNFSINGFNAVITGNRISLTLPKNTDLTNLQPEIIVAPKAKVSPSSNVSTDFTNPVKYTVTAQDGTTKEYEVSVMLGDVAEDQKVIYQQPEPVKVSTNITDTNKVKVNFLGDSITYGQDPANSGRRVTQYHAYLAKMINIDSANYGVSGSTISVLDRGGNRLPFTVRYLNMRNDADIIFVFGGTNDYGVPSNAPFGKWNDNTDTTFIGGLRVLMEGLIQKYPNKQIVFMTPIKRESKSANSVGKVLYEYVDAIKEMATEYGIPVIDAYNDKEMNLLLDKEMYISDGLHPTAKGHEKMANWIYQQLIDKKVITIDNPIQKIELNCSVKELIEGESYQLQATITPDNATNKELVWVSSNDQVVTVKDGKITAISQGETEITATSKDGKVSASCKVSVKKAVNKSNLQAVVNKIEVLDKTQYTKDSTKNLPDLLKEGKALLLNNQATQNEVDAMTVKLQKALDGLEENASELKAYRDSLVKEDASKYSEDSYQKYLEAYNALMALEEGNTSKKAFEQAKTALEDAMGVLCLKKADYSAVEAAVAKAKALNPKNYVDFSGVEKALQAVVYDLDITKQAEVDEYAKAINLAIESLEKKPVEPENPVNKEDLQEAVDKASKLDQKNYTEESWKSFEEAYAHAKDVLGNQNATKEEVAKAKDTLNEAIQQLKPVETKPVLPVDPKPEAPQDPEGEAPNTGDETHVFQYVTLLAISSLLLAGFVMMKKRRVVKK